ncbi:MULTISPECIES: SDR family oxidoreductase [Paraburkholderia]|uniref:SDR family oxidoreductase n=1 Tax=Paraburkholderia TaxID=1822464 RepID=UPI001CADF7A0|nr:hypothetical protein PCAR4_350154 [Paraburkholderia caribensis]
MIRLSALAVTSPQEAGVLRLVHLWTGLFFCGTYLTLHYTVPHLKRAGRGSIILISSINGTRVFSHGGASAYSTTKGGLLALGQMVALELAKHKIRVNVVSGQGRIGDRREHAGAIRRRGIRAGGVSRRQDPVD